MYVCSHVIHKENIMKRINFYLTEPQIEQLNRIAKLTGLKVAELVRRAVDKLIQEYADQIKEEKK